MDKMNAERITRGLASPLLRGGKSGGVTVRKLAGKEKSVPSCLVWCPPAFAKPPTR